MTSEARQDRLIKRKEEILAEATKLFASDGYARAKVDDLAARLGVGKGTIYRYFPTKEELFLSVADKAMENLQNAINNAALRLDDPFDKISAAIEAYLAFFETNMNLVEIFVHERAEFKDRKTPTYLTYRDKNIKNLEAVLAKMKTDGLVRKIDVPATASILGDLLYGTVYTHLLRGGGRKLSKLTPRIVDVFFNGILTPAGQSARNHSNGNT